MSSGEKYNLGGITTMQNENNGKESMKDQQRDLLNSVNEEFANDTYEHTAPSQFTGDPSRGESIEDQIKDTRSSFSAEGPYAWDQPIDVSKLNYNYGETVKPADPAQFKNQDGTLNVPHPSMKEMYREWDARYPKVNGIPVVGVKENGGGDIIEFKLATGQLLSYQEMLRPDVDLQGIVIGENREHELTLRSAPDGFRSNNLDELPRYE